jgi:hypothetical protein
MLISYGYDECKIVDDNQMHLRPTQFNGRVDPPVQCRIHPPMEGVQSFTQSHWTLPSGEYSLLIISADNRVACKRKMMKKHHTCWLFWWPWWCTSMIPRASPNGGGPGLRRKPLVDATGQVLQVIVGNRTKNTGFSEFFYRRPAEKGHEVASRPLITTGVWHINQMGGS